MELLITFGFLSLHIDHEVEYATEIARRAGAFGITVYRFTPTSIRPNSEEIDGLIFNGEKQIWEHHTFQIPQFLYDRCFYHHDSISKKSMPIVAWLKNNPNTTFIGHGLPNKWHIYKTLIANPILKNYVPKTEKAISASQIISKLKKEARLLLKPESGSQGRGIIDVSIQKERILMKTHQNQTVVSKQFTDISRFIAWVEKRITSENYLIQSFLLLQDNSNQPFDIRVFLQKDADGNWVERGRGIRKGKKGSFISNISSGGEIILFTDWMKGLTNYQQIILQDEINTIINHLPQTLEASFSNLFEIGIDIGMDKDDRIWILDSNSKPGRKVIVKTNPLIQDVLYQAPLQYCLNLAKQRKY